MNIFISALIAVFFLGKSTKEMKEKTAHASWFRTSVYLILTVIFGIFFYRTFQVATIINEVEIYSLRGVEDSLHQSKDTIETISYYNNFKTLGSYQNPYIDALKNDSNYTINGGIAITLKPSDLSVDGVTDREGLTEETKNEIETLTGKKIEPSTGSIYKIKFLSTTIPSLVPIFPIMKYDKPKVKNEYLCSTIEYKGNLKDIDEYDGKVLISKSNTAKGEYIDALLYQQTKVAKYKDVQIKAMVLPHPMANTIDILTAADLSQYTYMLEIHSDMYVNHLSVSYNVPIEVSNQPEGLVLSANGFDIIDAEKLNKTIGNQPMMFLVKLPTMANLQQIRSLVLTALVTALFSLFCTNLFYRLRRHAIDYKNSHRLDISIRRKISRHRVNDFKTFLYVVTIGFLSLILIVVLMAAFGYTFLIEFDGLGWKLLGIAGVIVIVFLVITYLLYRYAITPIKKKKDDNSCNT